SACRRREFGDQNGGGDRYRRSSLRVEAGARRRGCRRSGSFGMGSNGNGMSGDVTTMNIRIEGEVQGCGFRDFALREANVRRLKGWVRNRADGSLEAVASGPTQEVEAFIAVRMKEPPASPATALNPQ